MQRSSRKPTRPTKNDDDDRPKSPRLSKKALYTTTSGGRPVTLRSEVNDLFSFLAKTSRSLGRRCSVSSSRWKKRRNYLPLPICLVLFVGLAWYFMSGGGIDRRRREDLCRSHRSRPPIDDLSFAFASASAADRRLYQNSGIRFTNAPRISSSNGGGIGPHYDGLNFRISGPFLEKSRRSLPRDDYFWREFGTPKKEHHWDQYYAFDDDGLRNTDWIKEKMHCRRVSWHKLYNPSCNRMHETEVVNPSAGNKYLGSGFYRDVFLNHHPDSPDTVLKLNRAKANPFTYDRYEFIRMDALIMERLTGSPRIPDIYGHCGTSMLTELLPTEVEPIIIPGSGKYYKEKGDPFPPGKEMKAHNDFDPEEKVEHALAMAEALSDLHGFRDGVIVHDDLMPSQFLYAADGSIKLNDFNRGEAMLYDDESDRYCRYKNGKGGGDFRSPEEFKDGRLNEKIDVFSLGNMMYGLLTGLEVFYDVEEDKEVQKKLVDGELPYIDPRWKTNSYGEGRLVEIIEKCWKYKPNDRADVFQVTRFLDETMNKMRQDKTKQII